MPAPLRFIATLTMLALGLYDVVCGVRGGPTRALVEGVATLFAVVFLGTWRWRDRQRPG